MNNNFENNEKVSIIMPAYNADKYISESIKSVLDQSYKNFELIVVNDKSVDDTELIVKGFTEIDPRIYLINNDLPVRGAYFARNLALKKATGKYIAFLDSDDLWSEDKLTKQIKAMKFGGFYVSHSSYRRISEKGEYLNTVGAKELVTYKDQLKSNWIPNLTGIYDRSKLGTIEQANVGHEDYHMWLRILGKYPSLGLKEPLAYYRVLSNSLSSNKFKSALWHYNILKQQKDLGFIRRVHFFLIYFFHAVFKRF